MDSITTNISMPRGLYQQAKKQAQKYHYNSVSELIRDALRWWMNDNLTRNGFTPEFEEEVLKRAKEPMTNDIEWEGKESELIKHVKSTKKPRLYSRPERTSGKTARIDGGSQYASGMV